MFGGKEREGKKANDGVMLNGSLNSFVWDLIRYDMIRYDMT